MVLFEQSLGHMKVVLEALEGCVRRTEFQEFRDEVRQRFEQVDQRFEQIDRHMALVVGELRALRKDVASQAQAAELHALDRRVTALERHTGL